MDIRKMIHEMTLEDKASLLTGKKLWFMNGLKRFGIRDFTVSDGPHGVRVYNDFYENNGYPTTKAKATAFPCAACMASTWNEDLIHQVGETIGKECNHYKVDILLGPGVNGKRSPLGGRNFEYYSEDPVLAAKMGIAFVKGVQSQNVGTSVKHFVLNEQETLRRYISSEINKRTFRELYAYPFEQIIKQAKPLTVMAAYNKINGTYACENHDILTKLLRDEWGFEGIVLSDWGGVQNKRASVLAGLDVEMPESEWTKTFIDDVKNGKYPLELIDKTVERILKSYQWLLNNPNRGKETNFDDNHSVAVKVAQEGIVLLKNDNQILPFSSNDSIVVLGRYATEPRTHGGGSSELLSYHQEIPLEEINKYAQVAFYHDYVLTEEARNTILRANKVIIFTGTTTEIEHEGDDRINMLLPDEQTKLILEVAKNNKNIVVVNNSGSAVEVRSFIHQVKGFIQSWFLGSASGRAIADILFGRTNPSGKLSETFPIRIENTPTYPYFPGLEHKTDYSEGQMTGYRYYDTHQIPVSFPFGFGLSYSSFSYSRFSLNKTNISHGDSLTVHAQITNTSTIPGSETLQIYLSNLSLKKPNPNKVLKGFVKHHILPSQVINYEFTLNFSDFSQFYPEFDQFLVETGDYEIQIGTSVENILYKQLIQVTSNDQTLLPKQLYEPVEAWIKSPIDYEKIRFFVENNREIHFYEYEEPMERIIRRIMNEKQESEDEINAFLDKLRKY